MLNSLFEKHRTKTNNEILAEKLLLFSLQNPKVPNPCSCSAQKIETALGLMRVFLCQTIRMTFTVLHCFFLLSGMKPSCLFISAFSSSGPDSSSLRTSPSTWPSEKCYKSYTPPAWQTWKNQHKKSITRE